MRILILLLLIISTAVAQEPFASVITVEMNKDFNFKIPAVKSYSYHKFKVTKAGYVRFSWKNPNVKNLVAVCDYYSIDKKKIAQRETRLEPGEYYAVIYDSWNDAFSKNDITGKLEFYKEMDKEPDSPQKPRIIKPGKFRFAIMPVKDVDYLSFTAEEDGYIRMVFQPTGIKSLDSYSQIFLNNKKVGDLEARVEKSLTYQIRVYDSWSDLSAPKLLDGELQFFKEMDAEPDSEQNPRELKIGKFNYAIMPVKDVDFFEYTPDETGYLRVVLDGSGVKSLDGYSQIFLKGKKIGDLEARVEKGQRYLVKIYDSWSDRSAPKALSGEFQFFPEQDKGESNNTVETATPAEFGKTVKYTIMPVKDSDFYKLEVPGAGAIWFESSKSPKKELTPTAWIYDEDKKTILSKSGAASVIGPGTVYFQIYDSWSDSSSPQAMDLTFKFAEETDFNEPNNQPFMATEVGRTIQGVIFPKGDVDHYEIKVLNDSYLKIENLEIPKGLNISYVLVNEQGKALGRTGDYFKVKEGKSILKVWADGASTDFYSLSVSEISEFDELERDGEKAAKVEFDKLYKTATFPAGDVDFWNIEVDEPSKITTDVLGAPLNFYHTVEIYKEDGKALYRSSLPIHLPAGKFKLKVWGSKVTVSGYDLILRKSKLVDKYELNDDYENAKTAVIGQAFNILLNTKADVDFFKFNLNQKEDVKLYAYHQHMLWQGNVFLQVFTADKKPIGGEIAGVWKNTLEAGEYFLKLRAARATDIPVRFSILTDLKGKDGDLAVAVVGLKLNPKEKIVTEALAESTGSLYINSDESTTIVKAVEKAVTKVVKKEPDADTSDKSSKNSDKVDSKSGEGTVEKEKKGKNFWWIIIVAVILFILATRKKRREEVPAEEKPDVEKNKPSKEEEKEDPVSLKEENKKPE